jgi:hypothetical protein
MEFVHGLTFQEALDKLGGKSVITSPSSAADWSDVPVALRERAFFSSRVESARFLQRGQDLIQDFLAGNREVLPDGQSALKMGGRARFVELMRELAIKEGMGDLVDPKDRGGLKDITSQKRLELIYDIQIKQAQGFGYRKQGMDPDVLDAYPAQRFIRVVDVKDPRDWHAQFEDKVFLKTSPIWKAINQDFGVPWASWGWGCGHDVEDVDRDEAEAEGLLKPGEAVTPPAPEDFNQDLKASTAGIEPELLQKMQSAFKDQIEIDEERIKWKGGTDERATGDRASGRDDEPARLDPRRVGPDGQRIFGEVRSRDNGKPLAPEDALSGGAHLAAAASGRKPVFHEHWGQELGSDLARRIWGMDLPGTQVVLKDGHLYVYRPEAVQPIIDAHPELYPGVDLFDKIHRATEAGTNGELLGYGARSMIEPGLVRVEVKDGEQVVFGFLSRPEAAEEFARARALDFNQAYGREFTYRIKER